LTAAHDPRPASAATGETLEALRARQARAADEIAALLTDRVRRGLLGHEARLLDKQVDFFEAVSRQVEAHSPPARPAPLPAPGPGVALSRAAAANLRRRPPTAG